LLNDALGRAILKRPQSDPARTTALRPADQRSDRGPSSRTARHPLSDAEVDPAHVHDLLLRRPTHIDALRTVLATLRLALVAIGRVDCHHRDTCLPF
jgi:hypothetical protein